MKERLKKAGKKLVEPPFMLDDIDDEVKEIAVYFREGYEIKVFKTKFGKKYYHVKTT
jgi:hypothetical protein